MPITIPVVSVSPSAVQLDTAHDAGTLLFMACEPQAAARGELLQHSIAEDSNLNGQRNGFVRAALEAYGSHNHLRVRPDDVWIAILTQLCFYVNAHAEALRGYFVAHAAKRRLVVEADGNRHTVDFGRMSRDMTKQIQKNVVDGTLVEWILPDFTTTTLNDKTICSVVMMSTLKTYFEYIFDLRCGLPTITLDGTKADWQRILDRLDRLYEFGDEPSVWANMLRPILQRFVSAFDGQTDTAFWQHIVYRQEVMSGEDNISGWITAFCVWDHEGRWKASPLPTSIPRLKAPGTTTNIRASGLRSTLQRGLTGVLPKRFSGRFQKSSSDKDPHPMVLAAEVEGSNDAALRAAERSTVLGSLLEVDGSRRKPQYTLDGISYFTIDVRSIPAGYCEVDVTVIDNGRTVDCMMVSGHVAVEASASTVGGQLDTLAPAPQWFLFEKKSD
ncbi:hypothetical protein GY45DRAFT_1261031 [Cubamyces sp. BRFM 1775]|nr:hypothetical protein GY45DRAFT_1261031 [Cubamyces sp. BRFM 1775]